MFKFTIDLLLMLSKFNTRMTCAIRKYHSNEVQNADNATKF